jgi:hypothetical protein
MARKRYFQLSKTRFPNADWRTYHAKDYSNQRVSDFFNLSHPEEDMYDRSLVPRQPWHVFHPKNYCTRADRTFRHDIGLQLIGQPARDLCRHFVQRYISYLHLISMQKNDLLYHDRWNFLLRCVRYCTRYEFRLLKTRVLGPRAILALCHFSFLLQTLPLSTLRNKGLWELARHRYAGRVDLGL